MKKISILGSTGSIGRSTLDVIRHSGDFRVVGLCAKSNVALLLEQIAEFRPKIVAVWDDSTAAEIRAKAPRTVKVVSGLNGLSEVSANAANDIVVSALVGAVGLVPTLEAVKQGIDIALANKEVLVMAGEPFMRAASKSGAAVLPVDSEHSAIFQCLNGGKKEEVRRVIITASGGPFVDLPLDKLKKVTVKAALDHPRWSMGRKVTIDSASLMNKGLEVIEARWLFGLDLDRIDVV
ncbi:MAG TPA: 1-deoxy-D-xylulose-5-phosphate reductoisomerase, partial [bacterium]|nr:1-deoxy-D-xylulose-5-phosphate reductoisomerase [bacterium]